MIYLTLLSALLLSGIAAYYSVIGLAAIFTGAFWPIVFMGSVLEMSKLVTTSWLYRNWKTCPFLLKTYLTTAVVILMLITSMGIFGFLSKSHIDSTLDAGANSVEIKTLSQQEKIAKERLDYLLARAKDPSTASNKLDKQIQETQKELKEISNKKLPLLREENKLIAEVGPIKYVGEMVYGSEDDNAIDKAVRLVIMLIMVVFDPLAVLLLIAANMSMNRKRKEEENGVIQFFERARSHAQELDRDAAELKVEEPKVDESIKVEKENLATMDEKSESIVIDEASGESIPPLGKTKRGFPNRKSKELGPNYDYNAEYAFKEKEK
jgi:predicted Holliday junction resolvase-like endonuclease